MKTYSIMIGGVATLITLFIVFASNTGDSTSPHTAQQSKVTIGSTTISVEIARTPQERAQGLSHRTSLDENRGMLFLFEKPDLYAFWMPNMKFPIDIIWIDTNNTIVDIHENVPPLQNELYPTYYKPQHPAISVLEVNAGFGKRHNIKTGDKIIFNAPN